MRHDAAVAGPHRPYVPGMGHDWLLPFYDPLQKVLGIESLHRTLVDQADLRPGDRVLEIGCGTGNLLLLIKRLEPRADVVGLDPDPKALARARRKAARRSLPVQLDQGFAGTLPYPDASFDHMFSALMFHHLGPGEKVGALREARRVLRPGGSLHLLDFGGSKPHSGGLLARRIHRPGRLQGNLGDRIPTMMREANFEPAMELDHKVARFVGAVAYFRASVPASSKTPHGASHG